MQGDEYPFIRYSSPAMQHIGSKSCQRRKISLRLRKGTLLKEKLVIKKINGRNSNNTKVDGRRQRV
jgi:hypothetical protein